MPDEDLPDATERRPKPPNRVKLTKEYIRLVQPPAKRYALHWDTHTHGLVLKVERTGHKSYKMLYRFAGRQRWYDIKRADEIDLDDARKKTRKLMALIADGVDPQSEKMAGRGVGTFEQIATRYLKEYAQVRNKSWKQADDLVKRFAIPQWGTMSIKAIGKIEVRNLIGQIKSASVANQTLAAVSAVFSWAVKQDIIKENPCKGIQQHKMKSRARVPTEIEIAQIAGEIWGADIWGHHHEWIPGSALLVLLLTGQRPGEVCNMRLEHITEDGWWNLPGEKTDSWPGTKNGQNHRVWLPTDARKVIEKLSAGRTHGYVFRGVKTGLDRTMRWVCGEYAIEPKITPHDFRRFHGTTITKLQFGRVAMNRIQNHQSHEIADVYDRHAYEDEDKKIMETVAKHIMGIFSRVP
jgi:integrase